MKIEAYNSRTPEEFIAATKVVGQFLKYGTVVKGQFTMGTAFKNVSLDEAHQDHRPLSSAILALEQAGCHLPWVVEARVKWMRLILKTWEYHLSATTPGIELFHEAMHARCVHYLASHGYNAAFSALSDNFLEIMNTLRNIPSEKNWELQMWRHIQDRSRCSPGSSNSDPMVMKLLLEHYRLPLDCPRAR